jgi:hypothetical protein
VSKAFTSASQFLFSRAVKLPARVVTVALGNRVPDIFLILHESIECRCRVWLLLSICSAQSDSPNVRLNKY